MRRLLTTILLLLASPLLLSQPVLAQTDFGNLTMANVIVKQTTGGAIQPPDWTSSFVAVYDYEGASPWNQTGGTCGSDCNLTNSGLTQDGTTYQHNLKSAYANEGDGVDSASCAYATCDEISGLTGSFSLGMWFNNDDDTQNQQMIRNWNSGGFLWEFSQLADTLKCYLYDGAAQTVVGDNSVMESTDGWVWGACVHDASGGAGSSTLSSFTASVNSWDKNTTSSISPMTAPSSGDVLIPSSAAVTAMTGNIDEVFIYNGVLSDAAACRICSCGIDGSLCTYSGGAFVDEGRNDDECGGCTLCSNASAETPGTCS